MILPSESRVDNDDNIYTRGRRGHFAVARGSTPPCKMTSLFIYSTAVAWRPFQFSEITCLFLFWMRQLLDKVESRWTDTNIWYGSIRLCYDIHFGFNIIETWYCKMKMRFFVAECTDDGRCFRPIGIHVLGNIPDSVVCCVIFLYKYAWPVPAL